MNKNIAIKDAETKAALSRQDQVVFKYIASSMGVKGESGWVRSDIVHDYTSAAFWARRRHLEPAATFVTGVRYVPEHTGGAETCEKV